MIEQRVSIYLSIRIGTGKMDHEKATVHISQISANEKVSL